MAPALLAFVDHAAKTNELSVYLLLVKLLLFMWEKKRAIDFTSVGSDTLFAANSKLASHSVLGTADLQKLCAAEEVSERRETFQSTPRILLTSGHPSKLGSLEVQGKAVGIVGSLCAKPSDSSTAQYFEVTLKGKGFNGMRVGWALCGADLSSVAQLGTSDEVWVLDADSGYSYHNAQATSRARRGSDLRRSLSDDGEDADRDGESLFANLFSEDPADEPSEGNRDSGDSKASGDSSAAEEASNSFLEMLMFSEDESSQGAQAFLEFMREEDQGDVSSIRRLLMSRGLASQSQRAAAAAAAAGSASDGPPTPGGLAERLSELRSRTSALAQAVQQGSTSATSTEPAPAAAVTRAEPPSRRGDSGSKKRGEKDEPAASSAVTEQEREQKSRAAWKSGGAPLSPCSDSRAKVDSAPAEKASGTEEEEFFATKVTHPAWTADTVLGCLLVLNTGETKFFANGACIGSVPTRIPVAALAERGACPVFSCNPLAGLDINLGQSTFRFEKEVAAHLAESAVPASVAVVGAAGAAHEEDQQVKRSKKKELHNQKIPASFSKINGCLSVNKSPQQDHPGGAGGVLLEKFHTDGHKTLTLEASVRLTADLAVPEAMTPSLSSESLPVVVEAASPFPSLPGSGPSTPVGGASVKADEIGVSSAKYCILSCGPRADTRAAAESQPSNNSDDYGCSFGVDARGALYFEVHGGETVKSPPGACLPGQWQHVAATFTFHRSNNKASVVFLVNGVAISQQELTHTKKSRVGRIQPRILCIGGAFEKPAGADANSAACQIASTGGWQGDLCELRVWSAARSAERILSSMGRGKVSGLEIDLLGLFPLEEGCGNFVHDAAIIRNNVRSCETIRLVGEVQWKDPSLESATDDATASYLSMSCAAEKNLTPKVSRALEEVLAAVNVQDVDADAGDTACTSALKTLCASLASKFLVSSDKYSETYLSASESSPLRKFPPVMPQLKSVVDDSPVVLLLVNSLLRQSAAMLMASPADGADAVLVAVVKALLALLRVNISVAGFNPAAASSAEVCNSLLVVLLHFVSGGSSGSHVEALRQDAVCTIVAGLDAFIPEKSNQIFALECLALKNHPEEVRNLKSNSIYQAVTTIILSSEGEIGHKGQTALDLPVDPLRAWLTMSTEGDCALFTALCGVFSTTGNVAHLVPETLRPVVVSAADASAAWTVKSGFVAVSGPEAVPKAGELVLRGPHWAYGNQDGGTGSLGVVLEVGAWLPAGSSRPGATAAQVPAEASKVVVQWRNGGTNAYRYGVVSTSEGTFGDIVYDVSILRPASTSSQIPAGSAAGDSGKGSDNSIFAALLAGGKSDSKAAVTSDMPYTPEEVTRALCEEKGNSTISKRTILLYIKEHSPVEWQGQMRITKPANTLVGKMSASDVAEIYTQFHQAFSNGAGAQPAATSAAASSKLLRIEPRCAAKAGGAEKANSARVVRILAWLVKALDNQPPTQEQGRDDVVENSGPYRLITAIHAALTGLVATNSTATSDSAPLSVALLNKRVLRDAFVSKVGVAMEWNWQRGLWCETAPASTSTSASTVLPVDSPGGLFNLPPPGAMRFSEKAARLMGTPPAGTNIKILTDLSIDRNYLGGNLQIKNRVRSVEIMQSGDREWNTCICTTPLPPNSGIYRWYVKIKNFSERRGHCMLGVATNDFSYDEFLGQHQESWGVSPNLDLFHGGRKRRTDCERKLTVGCTVEVTLDTNKGTIYFAEISTDGSGQVIEPVGFENVRGVVVFPAFSLYSPGDCISILTSLEDIAALKSIDASQRTPTKFGSSSASASAQQQATLMTGAPQPIVMQYGLHLLEFAASALKSCNASNVTSVVKNPLVSVNLPHLLCALARWKAVPRTLAKEFVDALVVLLERLRFAIAALRGFMPASAELQAEKKLCDEILVQLTCASASYIGTVAASWITLGGAAAEIDNECLALETANATPVATVGSLSLKENLSSTSGKGKESSTDASESGTQSWLTNALFQQGFRVTSVMDESFMKAAHFGDGRFEEFIRWISLHDKTHKNCRRFGGEALEHPVKLLFAVGIYHGGHIRSTSHLLELFTEYAQGVVKTGQALTDADLQLLKPPSFVTICWESAMKIRMWAKELAGTGIAYEFVAQRVVQRCLFLLDLEQSAADQHVDCCESNLRTWLAAFPNLSDKTLQATVNQVRLFITDNCSVLHLRAAATSRSRAAELRRDGFKAVRAALGHISQDIGCGAKCALIADLAKALNGPEDSKAGPLSSKAGTTGKRGEDGGKEGHYLDGLDGISQALRLEMQGTFDSYYACLTEELAGCNYEEDCVYQLCLLDCLGVRLLEQDHTMLSRVNFFFSLQEILDNSLALISDSVASVTSTGAAADANDTSNTNKVVVKAAMKLFILMALQVATSRDEEREFTTSMGSASYGSVGDLQMPVLRRSKSGPATLSKSVFDILYSQLAEVSKSVLSLASTAVVGDKNFVPTVFISQSAQLIASEATTLLLCVSQNSVCQKILLRPKWLTLLLQMAVLSSPSCQQSSIMLLTDLLVAIDAQDLQLEHFDVSQFPAEYQSCWSDSANLPDCIVRVLLTLIGKKMLHLGSSPLVSSKDADFLKEITEIALPVISETVSLLRRLYLASSWTPVVERIVVADLREGTALSHANLLDSSDVSMRVMAALCMLGGQIDAPYRNCPIVFQNPASSSTREVGVGVFVDFHESSADKVQVACFKYDDNGAAPRGQSSAARSVSQTTILVAFDKIQALNRCPVEKLAISESVMGEVVRLWENLVVAGDSAKSATAVIEPKDAKEETSVKESKEGDEGDENAATQTAAAAGTTAQSSEGSLVGDLLALFRTTCSRVLNVMAQSPASADRLLRVVAASPTAATFLATLLENSQQSNKSGGLNDLLITEEYLMVAIRQRQKLWAAKKQASHTASLKRVAQSVEPATPKTPSVSEAKGPSGTNAAAESLPFGDGLLLPPPPGSFLFSTGVPLDSNASDRSLSPFPPHPPSRIYGGGARRGARGGGVSGGRGGGRGAGRGQWMLSNQNTRDESYDFAEFQGEESNEDLVESLTNMGFPARWCEIALDMTGGDPEEALNYILSNGPQLEEMAASMDSEEEEARTIMRQLAEAHRDEQKEGDASATTNNTNINDAAGSEVAQVSETAQESMGEHDHSVAVSDSLSNAAAAGTGDAGSSDLSQVKYAHLDSEFNQLLGFYGAPTFTSERLGCIYPGDDLTVLDTFTDPADAANVWYKLPYSDFDDGNFAHTAYGEDSDEVVVWAPRYFQGVEVIKDGPNESDVDTDCERLRGETLRVDKYYKIVGVNGALVREGTEIGTAEVFSIKTGDIVHAVEETFNSEGTLRLRIDKPVQGWISKLFGLVQLVATPAPLSVETTDSAADSALRKDSSRLAEKLSELDMLERLEDQMEFVTAVDSFGRDDRFFGTLQGGQYSRNRDRDKTAAQSVYNRRMRVSSMSSYTSYSQGLMKHSLTTVDKVIAGLMDTLQKLYSRRILLALVSRECFNAENPTEVSTSADRFAISRRLFLQQRPVDDTADPIKLELTVPSEADKFYRFLRLVTFRSEPFSFTGLEALGFSDVFMAAAEPGTVSIEQVLDRVVALLILPSSSLHAQINTAGSAEEKKLLEAFQASFITMLVESLAKTIRLSCSPKFAEHMWADTTYEEDLDNDVLEQPNLHYGTWITRILLQLQSEAVTLDVFKCWSCALKATSISMKVVVFNNLSEILSHIRENPAPTAAAASSTAASTATLLQECLSMIPIQRLLLMCTKKLWAEMEDAPAFSRYLQAFLHFLSEVDVSKNLIYQEALDVSGEVSPIPTGPAVSPRPTDACCDVLHNEKGRRICFLQDRPVIRLKDASSCVQLTPQKEIAGPWTVELWIRRNDPPADCDSPVSNPGPGLSSAEIQALQELEKEDENDSGGGLFSRRVGGGRGLSQIADKLQGVLRSELLSSSAGGPGGREPRVGLSGLLTALLGSAKLGRELPGRGSSKSSASADRPGQDADGKNCIPTMTLLSSSKGSIKLQAGGRVFGRRNVPPGSPDKQGGVTEPGTSTVEIDDPLQESDPVLEEAYCLSFAPGGGTEKKCDIVIPTGQWLHLAIVCQTSPLSLISVYVNGEVQDTLSTSMNLPLSVLGSVQPRTSFVGDVAEMRVWSLARTRLEILRDLDRDVSGAKSLVSHLKCSEGRGKLAHDKAGVFNSCKLHNCEWLVTSAPALRPNKVPAFMLGESEEAEGLFGSEIGTGAQVVEMTGVLKVQSVLGAQGELATDVSEVVCLCFRKVSAEGSGKTEIEGYLNWCERDVRSRVTGTIFPSGAVQLSIGADAIILGAPENLEWMRNLRFEGTLTDGRLKGAFALSTVIDRGPALAPGSARIDQLSLPAEIRYFVSARAAKSHLLVKESTPEGQYIATVEVEPYLKPKAVPSRTSAVMPPNANSSATASLAPAAESPHPPVSNAEPDGGNASPAPPLARQISDSVQEDTSQLSATAPTTAAEEEKEKEVDPDIETYGMCAHQGCMWLEWLVNSNCGNIAFGACTFDGLSHPDASVDANDDTWTYSVSGQASHGSDLFLCDTAEEGDIVSMQIDTDRGHIGFYKNYEFVVGFDNVNAHPKLSASYQQAVGGMADSGASDSSGDAFQPGIRPFTSLVAAGDSVSFLGTKSGPVDIIYPEADPQSRCKFSCQLVDGCLHGFGLMSLNTNTEKWFGNWLRGSEDGLHIRVDDVYSSFTGRLYSRGSLIRELNTDEASDHPDAASTLAAYFEFTEKRRAAAAETQQEGTNVSPTPSGGATASPSPGNASPAPSLSDTINAQLAHLHATTKITIVLHDAGGENSYFKIMRNVVAKKLFAAYAMKRECPVRSFVFKFNNTVIDGERTIESYGIDNNAVIEVTVNSINVITGDASALDAFLDESTAPYVVQIQYESGALVRSGVEIETTALRTLHYGEVIEAFKKGQSSDGVGRFRVADGWISEKLRGGNEARVVRILSERLARPVRYKVIREEGARIRRSPSLTSEDLGFCPMNTVLTVAEVRNVYDGRDDSDCTVRVRIESPARWRGWASYKDHILEKLPDAAEETGAAADDNAIQAEKERRMRVRAQRKVKLEMLKSKEAALKRRRRVVQTSGSLDVSQETFFLLKRRKSGDGGAQVSSDFSSVTCDSSSSGRTMVLGTRGFSRGVHYWEVHVNAASWGSVFIGVAPHEAGSWNGYGLLNYRATQAFGSETLYGSYFSVNDKVGVLLDMDHGTISFLKDGEDFNVGKVTVVNMGVAYHNMRRVSSRSAAASTLYPCLGVKSSGDQLSISKHHWVSSKGLAPSALLQRILQAKSVLHDWNLAYTPGARLEEHLIENTFRGYKAWCNRDSIVITSRPGISVSISTGSEAIERAAGALAKTFDLKAGKIVKTAYGEGCILGGRLNQLWYSYEGAENSAWYWRTDELSTLLELGTIKFDVEPSAAAQATASHHQQNSSPADADSITACAPALEYSAFREGLLHTQWSRADDEVICRAVNSLASKHDMDPLRISAADVEKHLVLTGLLPGKSSAAVHARYAALCVVNKAAAVALPFTDFNPADLRLPMVSTKLAKFNVCAISPTTKRSIASTAVMLMKNVIFTSTKMKVWNYAVKESTTSTTAPADEYERPDDLREININRVEARNAEKNKDALSFTERLRVSVFGQLMAGMGSWDERALRRAFVHMQDAGQGRAFFVKFTGEGVDDQGGPYRAVFQTAVGEEVVNMLELLVPCPNAVTEMGENRDKFVLNPTLASTSQYSSAYLHLGKLIGLACRHNILVALSLPKLFWKPLSGEPVEVEDLQAVDITVANSLKAISSTEMAPEQVSELLMQALTSTSSPLSQGARGPLTASSVQPIVTKALSSQSARAVQAVVELVQQLHLTSQGDGLKNIYRGMSAVVPTELLAMYTSDELEGIFCGEAEVDIAVLQKATLYESVSPTDR